MQYSHIPVLLNEVISALQIQEGQRYVDCTFGGGGYSLAIAKLGGQVLGIDLDDDAVENFNKRDDVSSDLRNRINLQKGNFDSVSEIARRLQFLPVQGVVFDLGVSSFQLDTASKGFSFMRPGPLDMRMDTSTGITAGKLLDLLDERSLTELFLKFSDEMHSNKIARAVVKVRGVEGPYWAQKTTLELANFVEEIVGGRKERIPPATRVFQALRMAVNDEAGNLDRGLRSAWECLEAGGRIVVVSFHSVEDRIVKHFMQELVERKQGRIVEGMVAPSEKELVANPRSRSGRMRVIERL
jgi:16S rRNA (cytosine1402-N4)-methyltransferase